MISHKYKCIFIHIPKCAGTSIESALGHLENYNGRGGQDHRTIRMIEQPYLIPKTFSSKENIMELLRRNKQHHFDKTYNFRNKYKVTKQQYKSYYKFTIVRNPWARAFSWYNNVMRDEMHMKIHGIDKDISFKGFLLKFAGKGMISPQLYWLKNFNGNIPLDFIGHFENLDEDVHKVFKALNMEDTTLPHKVKSEQKDFRDYYDKETNNIILNTYKEEIDLFGYTFER
ncbi:hypothetical protein GCM10023311_09450 [Flaviramulus aquimarinus]|uniref:Sulfotransferase family protein n=1 Tax=Flaviramulus aquimarinus TaxID=1170456 RepID=A0ABP9EXJ3_9FLAO